MTRPSWPPTRSALALACLLPVLSTAQTPPPGSPVDRHGALRIVGNKVVDQAGVPVLLNGMAYYWSNMGAGPRFYNRNSVKWLASDWKVGIVRASLGDVAGNSGDALGKAKAIINGAIEAGIYVVVDYHDHHADTQKPAVKSFFNEVAKQYGQLPNLIYETWNEPKENNWRSVIRPFHEEIIKEIRKTDPDNLILCGTGQYCQLVDSASVAPISPELRANILYSLHFYAATSYHQQKLRDKAQTALNNGIALMVTEGGLSEYTGGGAVSETEIKKWMDFLHANGISWMNWSLSDQGESSAALNGGAGSEGGWTDGHLTQSGRWVRNYIRATGGAVSLPHLTTSTRRPWGFNTLGKVRSFDALGRPVPSVSPSSATGAGIPEGLQRQ